MIRLLKRLAILAGLWLGVTVAGVVYINTRSPEQFEAATRINSSYVPEPLPPDDVMRAETDATRAEVETLYDQLIAAHHAIQQAHTDEWEKRWAGDAVTIATMAKEQALEDIDRYLVKADDSFGLEIARDAARGQKLFVHDELANAREKLRAVKNAP